jgi:hypothetical protein
MSRDTTRLLLLVISCTVGIFYSQEGIAKCTPQEVREYKKEGFSKAEILDLCRESGDSSSGDDSEAESGPYSGGSRKVPNGGDPYGGGRGSFATMCATPMGTCSLPPNTGPKGVTCHCFNGAIGISQ